MSQILNEEIDKLTKEKEKLVEKINKFESSNKVENLNKTKVNESIVFGNTRY